MTLTSLYLKDKYCTFPSISIKVLEVESRYCVAALEVGR